MKNEIPIGSTTSNIPIEKSIPMSANSELIVMIPKSIYLKYPKIIRSYPVPTVSHTFFERKLSDEYIF